MICPVCGVELRIAATETVVTGDASADTLTRVVVRQTLRCPNPVCSRKTPQQVEHLLYQSPDTKQR